MGRARGARSDHQLLPSISGLPPFPPPSSQYVPQLLHKCTPQLNPGPGLQPAQCHRPLHFLPELFAPLCTTGCLCV